MGRKPRDDFEAAIEDALTPGVFIGYRDHVGFVEGLESVQAKIARLIKEGKASRAVQLLETFIAGCYEKSEEIDDSGGSFGLFVEGLFRDWVTARQAARADPDETAGLLLSWIEDDDYGYAHGLEQETVKALDRAGLAALERAVHGRLGDQEKGSFLHRRKVEILKAIHVRRRDVDAYAALCEQEDELAPRDCEVLAELCVTRRRPEAALAWVERALELESKGRWPNRSAWRLPDLRRGILKKLGRSEEALSSAWEDYRNAPSVYSYGDLMKFVPRGQRADWHRKALAVLDRAELSAQIEILAETSEWDRLAEVVNRASRRALMALSHSITEPPAKKLAKAHPRSAAKLYLALGLRILEAKKSRYYDVALDHFEQARRILLRQGRAAEWAKLVTEVREKHGRKSGFMPGFERLAAEGRTSTRRPSFLERARQRWARKGGRRSSML